MLYFVTYLCTTYTSSISMSMDSVIRLIHITHSHWTSMSRRNKNVTKFTQYYQSNDFGYEWSSLDHPLTKNSSWLPIYQAYHTHFSRARSSKTSAQIFEPAEFLPSYQKYITVIPFAHSLFSSFKSILFRSPSVQCTHNSMFAAFEYYWMECKHANMFSKVFVV